MGRTTFADAMKVKCPLCGAEPGKTCVSTGPTGAPCGTHNARLRAVPVQTHGPYRLKEGWYCIVESKTHGPWNDKGAAQAGFETEMRRAAAAAFDFTNGLVDGHWYYAPAGNTDIDRWVGPFMTKVLAVEHAVGETHGN